MLQLGKMLLLQPTLLLILLNLSNSEGKPILAHGGASFAQELVKHGLVDEFRLSIHPVVLGKGISMFATTPHLIDLNLVSSTSFQSGIIVNVYATKNK